MLGRARNAPRAAGRHDIEETGELLVFAGEDEYGARDAPRIEDLFPKTADNDELNLPLTFVFLQRATVLLSLLLIQSLSSNILQRFAAQLDAEMPSCHAPW